MGKYLPRPTSNSKSSAGTIQKSISSSLFDIKISYSPKKTFIRLKFLIPFFNTKFIPQTLIFLENNFPGVLATKCFNDQGLPFTEEVKTTELGHLFEHILIKKLYDLKSIQASKNFIVEGRTEWDWLRQERGIFNIVISWGSQNLSIFKESLSETILLLNELILTALTPELNFLAPVEVPSAHQSELNLQVTSI